MKFKRLCAVLTALTIIATIFPIANITTVAATEKLTGRDDFDLGVNVHQAKSYAAYTKTYNTILDAKATGAKFLRTGYSGKEYTIGFVDLAAKHGMGVMLHVGFTYYDSSLDEPLTADQINTSGIYNQMYEIAATFKGKVKYYQINNEMCIPMLKGGNGFYASQFKDCSGIAVGLYASVKAIKAADPEAQIVVNFSWEHIGIIDAIKDVKLDADTGLLATENTENVTHAAWDLIGMDWYSNGRNKDFTTPEGVPIDYQYIIETLNGRHPEMDVIVCEANLWVNGQNSDGSIKYSEDPIWLENYIRYCYSNPKVKGFFVYELYDEPAYSNNGFNKESHFGIIDKNGNKKEVYETIRALYGGTGEVKNRKIPSAPEIKTVGTYKSVLYKGTPVESVLPVVYREGNVFTLADLTPADFSNGNFVEFDFYVEDAAAFKAAFARNGLRFKVTVTSSNGATRWCNYGTDEDIIKDGWNHITMATSSFFDRSGSFDWSSVIGFQFKFASNSGTSSNYNELAGMKVALANITSAKITTPANNVGNSRLVIDTEGFENCAERYYQWYLENNRKTIDPLNVSAYNGFEFDFYVENLETFKKMTTENRYYFSIYSEKNYEVYNYEIAKYVTKQGWNHISINISEYDSNEGEFDSTQFMKYGLHFENNKYADSSKIPNPYATTFIYLANFNFAGHYYVGKVTKKPTCTKNGVLTNICEDCGDSYTQVINAKGHTYKSATDKATIYADGRKYKKCSVCDYVASKTATIIRRIGSIKLSNTSYTYNGKVKTPTVTVKDLTGKVLKKNTDYTVKLASGRKNVGKYKVTITFKGKYSGTKTFSFTIKPVKTTVSKLTAGKKSLKVNITKKSTQVTGYQVQYSTSKTFKSAKTKTISSYKTTSTTLSKLSAKKTYYVRVRTYKTVNGTKYYSGWSTYKYTKTK